MLKDMIKVEQVTTTYNGLNGCACGCGGEYIDGPACTNTPWHRQGGPGLTRRLNLINRNLERVNVFEGLDEMIAELESADGERVTRVYFKA